MAKVILICGKICCGKTTYAQKLCEENNAILLSVDEITLALFGRDAGENHDTYVERTEKYLFEKSIEIIETGINVVLDWGFWMKEERDYAKEFYKSKNIECEFHYIDISDETWSSRLKKRNSAILVEETTAYYVDESFAQKCASIFEVPNADEIDVVFQEKQTIIVRKLKVSEISMLTVLFNYKDVSEMIDENTRDIESGSIDIFALFDRDKIIGELRVKYISDDNRFAEKGKRAYLYAFRIHENYQGKGLGSYLLENVLTILNENGYSEFTVGVEDDNTKARYMYEKNGFTEFIARIKESYQGDSYEYDLLLKR